MPRVQAFLMRRGPFGGDGLAAIATAIVVELQLGLSNHIQGPRAVNAVSGLLVTLPIALRRRYPLLVAPGMTAVVAIQEVLNGDLVENSFVAILTVPMALYALGALCRRRAALTGFAAAMLFAYVSVFLEDDVAGGIVFVTMLVGGPFLVGRIVNARSQLARELREKAARLEREQAQREELAVANERARIAREMHDVLTHNVSVMVVQAAAARRMVEQDPERARGALESVEATGREALTEMRRLLGVLRPGGERAATAPQPSIADLDALVERARQAGLDVEMRIEGDARRLQSSVDLSVFRIVQEALANTLKHAGPAHAKVIVRYRDDEVEVDVSDDGRTQAPSAGMNGGHGLVGIRERVAMLGGQLECGRRQEGGFGVHARLPLTGSGS